MPEMKAAKAIDGQPTWKDAALPDLRTLAASAERAPKLVNGANTADDAVSLMRSALGIHPGGYVDIATKHETVRINDSSLPHVVEKRSDQRERFASMVIPTLERPTEVWSVKYGDGSTRNRYIKLFAGAKYDLLVMVKIEPDGSVFWNMMQRDRKSMNKLRIGKLL